MFIFFISQMGNGGTQSLSRTATSRNKSHANPPAFTLKTQCVIVLFLEHLLSAEHSVKEHSGSIPSPRLKPNSEGEVIA